MLDIRPDGTYCDTTLGGGGHFERMVARLNAQGRAVGIDRDADALSRVRSRGLSTRAECLFVHGNYADIERILATYGIDGVDGVLMDLGMSSLQLDDATRGFSFRKEGRLDMRMDRTQDIDAAAILQQSSEQELAAILQDYGEIHNASRMAHAIKVYARNHDVITSADLMDCLRREYGPRMNTKAPTKLFQALRIAVNDELTYLEKALQGARNVLYKNGRLAVIAYHSLEDRMVKRFMRDAETQCVCDPQTPMCTCTRRRTMERVNRKAIKPDAAEIAHNPRARSARLRVARRV
jgi:16S rRNA (cytosine1402-N4)-methyltransferase